MGRDGVDCSKLAKSSPEYRVVVNTCYIKYGKLLAGRGRTRYQEGHCCVKLNRSENQYLYFMGDRTCVHYTLDKLEYKEN